MRQSNHTVTYRGTPLIRSLVGQKELAVLTGWPYFRGRVCTATEMIPTIEMISATEMTPNHHRNDPHHRNDTGGHHRNDPRNIGNGIKRTTKTGQQFRACFLFIYIASFLRCVIYLFTALYFAVNCLFGFFLV